MLWHHRLVAATLVFLVVGLAGCASPSDEPPDQGPPGVAFPIYTLEGPGYPAAMIEGTLTLDSGCLWIDAGEERYLALWPEGWTVARSGDTVTVTDPAGTSLVSGTVITVGGGEEVDQEFMASLLDAPVPEACRGEPGWLVTEILE